LNAKPQTPRKGDPGKRHPATEISMTITVRDTPKTHPATGVSYIYNALAFNTLLSSQETDAHRRRTLIPLRGNSPTLLRSTLRVNGVSQIFPGRCRHRHPPAASSKPPASLATRETPGVEGC